MIHERMLKLGEWDKRDRSALLKLYYERNRGAIEPIIMKHRAQGHRIALWCGGEDGGEPESAFVSVFDPDGDKIACFCRAAPSRIANPQREYPMMKHDEAKADVVLYLYPDPYRVMKRFHDEGLSAEFVLVEDEIWKHVARSESPFRESFKIGEKPRGESKICSLTILYNPDNNALDALSSYSTKVDKAYVFDNSPVQNHRLVERIRSSDNIAYISGEGFNWGICVPVNIVSEAARVEGYDWLITFDQDSIADADMIERMRDFISSDYCTNDIALVGAFVHTGADSFDHNIPLPRLSYVDHHIQSGMMHRLTAMKSIGPYEERLFIDEVENEYCSRARGHGFHTVRLNHAILLHQVNDAGKKRHVDKYSASRYYYRTRNMLHMRDRWRDANPHYASDCIYGLLSLFNLLKSDSDPGDKALAMMLGYLHYSQGVWPTYEEALRGWEASDSLPYIDSSA